MRPHGGPDAQGRAPLDLSTGANPAGALPRALQRVRAADPSAYPDPQYLALRARLADWHGVAPDRLLFAASASEFIQRITALAARIAPGPVALPRPGYGDYASAARACGLGLADGEASGEASGAPGLRWCAEPGSPDGRSAAPPTDLGQPGAPITALDLAYAPLRLDHQDGWSATARSACFQLVTPNKALGLCGVRGAYAIAPQAAAAQPWVEALRAAEPSWPLGAQGVALLEAWCDDEVQSELRATLPLLRAWRAGLAAGLSERGGRVLPGVTPFVAVQVPPHFDALRLRERGVAVRPLDSFGLPGHWRVNSAPDLSRLWKALA
jgi:histidinol-phosphate aminotransferase